jgi:acyl-CoA thioesterase
LTAEYRLPERIGLTGLARAGDTWSVRIEPFNSNFGGSIYGGAALGAAVEMLESVTGSRVRWATARFLRAPSIGSELVLSQVADFVGRRSSHVTVTATHGDQVAFEVTAVVGSGNTAAGISGQWAAMPALATSLDNTIRYAAAAVPQSEWVLVDVHAHASSDGYAYGDVHLFSESGTLLATGSQTCIARVRAADPAV